MHLNQKHRLFIENYSGNIIEAMQLSGFEGAPAYLEQEGKKLLKNPTIIDAIRQRTDYLSSTIKAIATRTERQSFWTNIMRNQDPDAKPELQANGVTKVPDNIPLAVRLKASELLGKSETDFVDKVDVHHNLSISDVIKEAYAVDAESLDQIEEAYEAQYNNKKKKQLEIVDADFEDTTAELEMFI